MGCDEAMLSNPNDIHLVLHPICELLADFGSSQVLISFVPNVATKKNTLVPKAKQYNFDYIRSQRHISVKRNKGDSDLTV